MTQPTYSEEPDLSETVTVSEKERIDVGRFEGQIWLKPRLTLVDGAERIHLVPLSPDQARELAAALVKAAKDD